MQAERVLRTPASSLSSVDAMEEERSVAANRLAIVSRAVDEWKKQLIDLSGRNQLLFYRDLKVGTLRLDDAVSSVLQRLVAGDDCRLSRLFPNTTTEPVRLDDARKRARALWKKARENLEERGIETLFLAAGMATWRSESSSATPNAPVFVNTLSLQPYGAGKADYSLRLTGEWELNATMVQLFAAEFGVEINAQPLAEAFEDSGFDVDAVSRRLKLAARAVPGLEVANRHVAGNFAYTKLPMVRDIEESVEFLAESDLIAAIAGDPEAQRALAEGRASEVDAKRPDKTPPEDEFLILDADSSQSRVVNSVIDGDSVVVQGPPGTGKSQTISNLIASLSARGKRTLFVAEKRAAIEAVVKRLRAVGLGHLVMDLHGGISSKRAVAKQLGESLGATRSTPLADYTELHRKLAGTRDRLLEYEASLHREWEPWGVSMWDAQARLLTLSDQVDTGFRFEQRTLENLTADVRLEVLEDLHEWAERTREFRLGATPWVGAVADTPEDVDLALEIVRDVAHKAAPELATELEVVIRETGIRTPQTVEDWSGALDCLSRVEALSAQVKKTIWDENVDRLSTHLDPGRRGLWARLWAQLSDADYRQAKARVRGCLIEGKANGEVAARIAGASVDIRDNWRALGADRDPTLPSNLGDAHAGHKRLVDQLAAFGAYLSGPLGGTTLQVLEASFLDLEKDSANLRQLPFIYEVEQRLIGHGLSVLLERLSKMPISSSEVQQAFDLSWLNSVRSLILDRDRVLQSFNSQLHDSWVEDYARADRDHLATTSQRVARSVAEAATTAANAHPDQQQLIRGEANKRTRHRPLRQLIDSAPELLTTLRPCWVMSPLVVSQMLPAKHLFDVVIFDEASQVLPADAVPALARAPQVVIAGDRHQLPPTVFFASRIDGSVGEEDDEEVAPSALLEGFESVLDVASSLLNEYMLTWHYRSEDERLIAFSNHHIYGGALTTFPGVGIDGVLNHELVPFELGQEINTRSNSEEVRSVVELMIKHARNRPSESLGVIAMGVEHANRIDAHLENSIRDLRDAELEAYFGREGAERPFVKNLERVQGDERDAILLSIGYGKDRFGKLAMRFGPINHEGGHRRLNVAVTRARKRVMLVSSFGADEVDLSRTNARGVEVLKSYLKYVDSGGVDLSGVRSDVSLNPFELSVRDRLEREGLVLIPQYGVSGFRIDFAVRHPEEHGRMLLAIEADGASYHSTPTARDRDRLRQQMLERLGWRFHRIWSTSWFNDQDREVERVMSAYEEALRDDEAGRSESRREHAGPQATRVPSRGPRPRLYAKRSIDDYSDSELVAVVNWILSDTLLRTEDQMLSEVMDELGFRRRGSKIVSRITSAIRSVG